MISDENLDLHEEMNSTRNGTYMGKYIHFLIKSFKKIIDYFKNYINIVWGFKYYKIKWMKTAKKTERKLMGE